MIRVAAIKGEHPTIVVVPHGFDDPNTTTIGEQIIKELDCYGVINYGWERSETFDYYKDKANCNNIEHLHEDVIKQEFLEPIQKFVHLIEMNGQVANIFIIHGVSNEIRRGLAEPPDIILGIGDGSPPSFSCEKWVANAFADLLKLQGLAVYFGKVGGKYSGRSKNNLNQLFQKWYPNDTVQSIQLEIVRDLRKNIDISKLTGDVISMCIEDLAEMQEDWDVWENHNFGNNYKKI